MNKQQIAAKNYLMRAYRIDNRINSKLDQIAALNDLATRATSNISDMPGSPNRNIHKLEDAIVRIVDLQNEIGSDVNSLLEIKSQIVESIKQVTDPEGQVVLEERYLCYAKWDTMRCSSDIMQVSKLLLKVLWIIKY